MKNYGPTPLENYGPNRGPSKMDLIEMAKSPTQRFQTNFTQKFLTNIETTLVEKP